MEEVPLPPHTPKLPHTHLEHDLVIQLVNAQHAVDLLLEVALSQVSQGSPYPQPVFIVDQPARTVESESGAG